jgi:diguanylate cyclase (GGDEF)-like protein/PAS domain S-box-containing protein
MPAKQRRQWLWFIAVFVLLATLGSFNLYRAYRNETRQEENRILTQTHVISRNMEHQIAASDAVLRDIVRDISFLRQKNQHERARKRLQVINSALSGVRTLFFTDAEGTIQICNHRELEGKNFAHRDYYTTPKSTGRTDLLYVSTPFKSVLGAYVINLTRIITKPDGSFDGVVTAGIDPEYFKVLLDSVLYAPDMITTINHHDGIRFMIEPYREGQAGKNIAVPGSMFTLHKQSGRRENLLTDIGYATGERRTMALVTLDTSKLPMDKPPTIIAGRKREEILAHWKREAAWQTTVFFAALLMAGFSLWRHHQREAEKAKIDKELAELRHRFVDIFEFLPDATLVVDNDKKVVAWNRAMEELSGVPKKEMLGKGDNAYTAPFYGEARSSLIDLLELDDQELASRYSQVQRSGDALAAEGFCPALHNGVGGYVWAIVAPLHDAEGRKTGAIEAIRDISEAKRLESELLKANRKLAEQARIDELTGIYNRRMFCELMQAELARSCRYGTPVSLIMFDIDRFKKINDTLGHNTGDHVLQELTRLVSGRLRTHDIFGRWGGEEFMVLVPKNDVQQATQLAEILRELIAWHDFGDGLRVTASFGVSCHVCEESPEILVERADAALYQAKNSGRNRVEHR